MNYPDNVQELSYRFSKSNDPLEKYELLMELSILYKSMWKMNKALEVSQQALALSREIIYNRFPTISSSLTETNSNQKENSIQHVG